MFDKLVEISRDDLVKLRDLYKVDWPKNHVGYYTIQNYITWFEKESNIKNLSIYSLNGDWSDGTYLIVDRYHILINTLNETYEKLIRLLSLLDWSNGYSFSAYIHKHRSTVEKFIKQKGLKTSEEWPMEWYFLTKEDADKIESESYEGITVRPMREDEAILADELWAYSHPGSLYYLKRLIKLNINMAAFTADNEMIAWCFRMQYGGLGNLQVKDTYRRRGIGSLIVKAMTKAIADSGDDVFASVYAINKASRNMFEKIGFKVVDTLYWMTVEPSVPFEWNDSFDEEENDINMGNIIQFK